MRRVSRLHVQEKAELMAGMGIKILEKRDFCRVTRRTQNAYMFSL
jgi:hypothetical protein